MQFLAYFIAALACFFFGFTYKFKHTPKPKTQTAPEPPGALPVIGHLHLLRTPNPLARTLGTIADKHGPIYSLRLGNRHALVVSSQELIEQCLAINDKNFATRPCSALTKSIGFNGVGFALAPYGTYWRDMKKMVNLELFATHPLQKLRHIWNSEVKYLIHDLYSISQKNGRDVNVNLTKWLEHEMCNITVRILAGKRLCSEDWEVKEAIKNGLYLSGIVVVSDFIPGLEWMDIGGCLKALRKSAKELDSIAGKWLQEHLEKGVGGDSNDDKDVDFIQVMLSKLEEGTNAMGYTRDAVIRATLVILMLTGTESTTETMIWALSLLLNNPDTLKAAQDELDVHVGRNKWVEESDISKLEYLQAIVKETLRLYPPGPLAGPHEAIDDCYVGGYYVPKGTRLIVNVWQLHHDSQVWSDPYEFRPERFLKEHSGVNYQGKNFEYIPFSAGRRMCPASTFALQVIHLTLARLLQGFDLSTLMGKLVDMSEGLGIALPKVKPLEAVLTPRLSPGLYQNV